MLYHTLQDGATALHVAAQVGHTAVATSLLKASSDPNSMALWQVMHHLHHTDVVSQWVQLPHALPVHCSHDK